MITELWRRAHLNSKTWTTASAIVTLLGCLCLLGFTETIPMSFKNLFRFAFLNSNKTKTLYFEGDLIMHPQKRARASTSPMRTKRLAWRIIDWLIDIRFLLHMGLLASFAGHPRLAMYYLYQPYTIYTHTMCRDNDARTLRYINNITTLTADLFVLAWFMVRLTPDGVITSAIIVIILIIVHILQQATFSAHHVCKKLYPRLLTKMYVRIYKYQYKYIYVSNLKPIPWWKRHTLWYWMRLGLQDMVLQSGWTIQPLECAQVDEVSPLISTCFPPKGCVFSRGSAMRPAGPTGGYAPHQSKPPSSAKPGGTECLGEDF